MALLAADSGSTPPAPGRGGAPALPCAPCTPSKVIFLDVDGVLVSSRGLTESYEPGDPGLFYAAASGVPLERCALRSLAALVAQSGARIVVSSTWRLEADLLAHLRAALEEFGIGGALLGGTPSGRNRGEEVEAWLAASAPAATSFVILEDSDRHIQCVAWGGRGALPRGAPARLRSRASPVPSRPALSLSLSLSPLTPRPGPLRPGQRCGGATCKPTCTRARRPRPCPSASLRSTSRLRWQSWAEARGAASRSRARLCPTRCPSLGPGQAAQQPALHRTH
jgi:hypothetical protein